MIDPAQVNPLQTLVDQQTSLQATLFPSNSRYAGIATATWSQPSGKPVIYLKRRFLPAPERFQLLQEHSVAQGERLDTIAAQYMVDPTLFWRLCDANGAMRPEELTETISRRLRVTLPEGIPGAPHA